MAKQRLSLDAPGPIDSSQPASGIETPLIALCGLGAALVGLVLSIVPSTLPQFAHVPRQLSDAGVEGGTLMMGGLVLVVLSILRRGQQSLEAEIWRSENDPVREEFARDALETYEAVVALGHSLMDVSRQVKDTQAAVYALVQGDGRDDALEQSLAAALGRLDHALAGQSTALTQRIAGLEQTLDERLRATATALEGIRTAETTAPDAANPSAVSSVAAPTEDRDAEPELDATGFDPLAYPADDAGLDRYPAADALGLELERSAVFGEDVEPERPDARAVSESLTELASHAAHAPAAGMQLELAPSEPVEAFDGRDAALDHDVVSAPEAPEAPASEPLMIDLDAPVRAALPEPSTTADPLAGLGIEDDTNISDESLRLALRRLSQNAD